jgi:hypothetical protein
MGMLCQGSGAGNQNFLATILPHLHCTKLPSNAKQCKTLQWYFHDFKGFYGAIIGTERNLLIY